MDYFDRLGAALEDAWTRQRRTEERFPEVALEALQRLPPREAFDREALIDTLLDPRRPVPQQLAPLGAFGQPGFTVHHGHSFVIEVYHWIESLSAIHNHPFRGVFTILDGFSVHARYATGEPRALGGRALRLAITLQSLDLLEAGAMVPFSPHDHPLVHALIHVPRSTFSMVVRTVRTEGYLRYLPPSIALPMEAEAEPRGRQIALVDGLAAAGDPRYPSRLRQLLRRADFELALRILGGQWSRLGTAARVELVDALRSTLGDDVEQLAPVLDRAERLQHATTLRESLDDPDLRLAAVALGYAERRPQVLDLLRARGLAPHEVLHRLVDCPGLFGEGQRASAVVAHALIDGRTEAEALEALRGVYGAEAVAGHEAEVAEFCASSVFAVLGVDRPASAP